MLRTFLLLPLVASLLATPVFAQKTLAGSQETPPTEAERQAEALAAHLDTLVADWSDALRSPSIHTRKQLNTYGFAPEEVPHYEPEVIERRLQQLNTELDLAYNPMVQAFIDMYTKRKADLTSRILGLKEVYFPIFEDVLIRHNMPLEVKYLAVIESALNPRARSRAAAQGLWQFIYSTGRMYDLDVTNYIDERNDPFKATEAAASYLSDLHKMFGDWYLAMGAYNCGPGRMRQAIRQSGGKTTFWEVAPYLPRETRSYVPAFIAAAYVMNYADAHNIYPAQVDFTFYQDSIKVLRQRLNLRSLAARADVSYETLRALNPELRRGIVPYTKEPYTLRVPHQLGMLVRQASEEKKIQLAGLTPSVEPVSLKKASGQKLIYHRVERYQDMADIAKLYDVSVEQLKSWNNFWAYRLRAGQKVKVYVPLRQSDAAARSSALEANQAAERIKSAAVMAPTDATSRSHRRKQLNDQKTKRRYQTYRVRPGDSLWIIARRYDTSVDKLVRLNGLRDEDSLEVGQKLRLR